MENILAELVLHPFLPPVPVRIIEFACAIVYLYFVAKTAIWFIAPMWNSKGDEPDDFKNAMLFLKKFLAQQRTSQNYNAETTTTTPDKKTN